MRFTWNTGKERTNKIKHGLSFSLPELVYNDEFHTVVYDRFEDGEDRWHMLGAVGGGFKVLVVVFTYPIPTTKNGFM